MGLTEFAIQRKRVTGIALVVILAAGVSAYVSMSRDEDPGFIIRTALVRTIFPGASPERVEQLVTDKLEKKIQEMPEIDFIASQSKPGVSLVFVNIKESYGEMRPIWDNLINQARAQRAGLSNQDVAISLQTVLSGISTTDYREEDEVIPVVLRSVAADRQDVGKLDSHNIYVQATGRTVPLKQVADVEVVFQPAKVLRRDRLKTVTVDADLEPGYNAIAIARELDGWLAEQSRDWPVGYRFEQGGELESSAKAQESIAVKLPVAGLIIVLLLVWQFDSLRRPTIILLTIPLGMIGVILGLLITQQPFGFMALLGMIALSGIVINNAIVLIDRIKIEIEQNGLEPSRAVVEACQRRLRPILLTTATTVGGLVPLWLGGGPLFEPLAVAILFGLLFAATLTLGVVPILYSLFFRVDLRSFEYERTH